MMAKLKPCPFCGNEAKVTHVKNKHFFRIQDSYPFVKCNVCGASTPLKYTEDEVITAWNRRVNDA